MDRKQAKKDYLLTLQPMGIVQVRNLKTGRCLIIPGTDTRGMINRLRFQLQSGAFSLSQELCAEWKTFGEENFTIEVLDELNPVDEPKHDYEADLQALLELWLDKLQPYGDRGYHRPRKSKATP